MLGQRMGDLAVEHKIKPPETSLTLNRDCHCWPVERQAIINTILAQNAASNMDEMLSERPHYFANTGVFISPDMLAAMTDQIGTIEDVIKLPAYIKAVTARSKLGFIPATKGVFMGYDFHVTENGPKLIEINSNAGGAFIVDMIEKAVKSSSGHFAQDILAMFQSEWELAGKAGTFKTLAIVDTAPTEQFHYPDMCLAKSILEAQGIAVVIADPKSLTLEGGALFHGDMKIDVVYNRLTDFDLQESANQVLKSAYGTTAAVVTPAPHHHALYADKRNLIMLSDPVRAAALGASPEQLKQLAEIPHTTPVTAEIGDDMWAKRRSLFFKPQGGFGSRGAFRGAKLTKKVWGEILEGGYIAQEMVTPPLRAVTVGDQQTSLKFDVRVYTYDGAPLLLATRIYQGQTTNLRTEGGGLAAVIPVPTAAASCPI